MRSSRRHRQQRWPAKAGRRRQGKRRASGCQGRWWRFAWCVVVRPPRSDTTGQSPATAAGITYDDNFLVLIFKIIKLYVCKKKFNERVSYLVWYWPDPDPDPTSQDKLDPDSDPTSQDKPDPDLDPWFLNTGGSGSRHLCLENLMSFNFLTVLKS